MGGEERQQLRCVAEDVSVKREGISLSSGLLDAICFNPQRAAEMEDDGEKPCVSIPPEKKRRLRAEQVEFLERSFEAESRLEPQRKALLAKEAGLQERQVAIWFQNRRARCKSKLLERDYASLKLSFQKLKADYDAIVKENEEMRNEIILLSEKRNEKGEKLKNEPSDEGEPNADSLDSDFTQDLEHDDRNKHSPKLVFEWDEDVQPALIWDSQFMIRGHGSESTTHGLRF